MSEEEKAETVEVAVDEKMVENQIPLNTSISLQILYIPREKIVPNENQIRKEFPLEHINALKIDIEKYSIREPLKVRVLSDNTYQIVDGECRYRAAEQLGLKVLPCIILDEKSADMWEITANLLRNDLNCMEKSDALLAFIEKQDKKLKNKDLAELVGKSESLISELLNLQNLSGEIKEDARKDSAVPLRKLKKFATKKMQKSPSAFSEYNKIKELYKKEKEKQTKKFTKKDPNTPDQRRIAHINALKNKVFQLKAYYTDGIKWEDYNEAEKMHLKDTLKSLTGVFKEIAEQVERVEKEIH